jgi:hypothetical protein
MTPWATICTSRAWSSTPGKKFFTTEGTENTEEEKFEIQNTKSETISELKFYNLALAVVSKGFRN